MSASLVFLLLGMAWAVITGLTWGGFAEAARLVSIGTFIMAGALRICETLCDIAAAAVLEINEIYRNWRASK